MFGSFCDQVLFRYMYCNNTAKDGVAWVDLWCTVCRNVPLLTDIISICFVFFSNEKEWSSEFHANMHCQKLEMGNV